MTGEKVGMNLYVTADQIGTPTGGGLVTFHESEALKSLGPCEVWGCVQLQTDGPEPWKWDARARKSLGGFDGGAFAGKVRLAHFYSGTFSETVRALKEKGTKVSYTIAAHDKEISRQEHEALGCPFPYPHLTEEPLWQRYIGGYRDSDVIVCPSTVAARTVRNYGSDFRDKKIVVIPHGCELPERTAELPARFTVGYLGSYGFDKGIRYLLEAWKRLNYKDATLLLGGKDSTLPFVRELIHHFGGGIIQRVGWVEDVSDFYDACSLYVQPSATEGFGIEILEGMAHARPVLCSDGAGACDVVPEGCVVPARDPEALATKIEEMRRAKHLDQFGQICRQLASHLTWDKVRQKYVDLWRSLL